MPVEVVSVNVAAMPFILRPVVVHAGAEMLPDRVTELSVAAPLALRVVNAPVLGVVAPIAPGLAQVLPSSCETLRFPTTVVEVTTRGAVPVAMVLMYCGVVTPDVEKVATPPPVIDMTTDDPPKYKGW